MLEILYRDDALTVCVKPFRVLSTDEPGGMPDLIREALGEPDLVPRTVHRLDQVVGGLMVYGLTPEAASGLSRQIREDEFLKEYLAVIHWRTPQESGTFHDLLGRDPKTRKSYVSRLPGKGIQDAILHYRLLESDKGFSAVRIRLETGRTHQIRAQFSSRGLPLAGDRKYSRSPDPKEWQIALWSSHLAFRHPVTGEPMDFRLAPPREGAWELFPQEVYTRED